MKQARAWFFQANPVHYDIDAALSTLDRIWWRVPQYTSEINVGDAAVLWRSGNEAGIVGLGRIVAEPQLRAMDSAETPFVLTDQEGAEDTTRSLVRVQAVPFIAKDQVRAIVEFRQHQIVVAPMGTVFPISGTEWTALSKFLPQPPEIAEGDGIALPPGFAWSQRAKGVLPMPGGYGGYLTSLRKVCAVVAEERPAPSELAVRDAFDFLGFQAEWLGGSGKTDVLLAAALGATDSYRVVVDCKTSGSGSVSDHQVDWVTLTEHKAKHDADHIAVVAPNPSGSRMFARASQHNVAVISADQLAGLCRQHAKTPLGLDDYRSLFATGGSLDMQAVDERAEDVKRLVTLAAAICEAIRDRSAVFGRLSARDLFLILSAQTVAEGTTEDELQALLDTLASPLLAVLQGSKNDGYRVTTSAKVAQRRIEMVAQQLSASQP
jgi:hypothetical protein